jgi:hypothetical protein
MNMGGEMNKKVVDEENSNPIENSDRDEPINQN